MNTTTFINQHLQDFTPYLQQLLVFIHLFAFAFAIVVILSEDVKLLISKKLDISELHSLASKITYLLAILWITGIGLLAIKPGLNLDLILANPKLTAKITVVSILTINGMLLHFLVFPSFSSSQKAKRIVAVSSILGAISTTTWIYAGLVGSARAIAPLMSYQNYMSIYLVILAFALLTSAVIIYPLMKKIVGSISYSEQPSEFLLSASSFSNSLKELRGSSPSMEYAHATNNYRVGIKQQRC